MTFVEILYLAMPISMLVPLAGAIVARWFNCWRASDWLVTASMYAGLLLVILWAWSTVEAHLG